MAKSERIYTPMFRVSYPNVLEQRKDKQGNLTDKYDLQGICTPEEFEPMKKFAEDALKAKFGPKAKFFHPPANPEYRAPWRNGDEAFDTEAEPHYAGMVVFSLKSGNNRKPGLVQPDGKTPITKKEDFYGGCYAYAKISTYAYDREGKGISFGVDNICKLKDGEPFVAANSAEDDFGGIDVQEKYGIDNTEWMKKSKEAFEGMDADI